MHFTLDKVKYYIYSKDSKGHAPLFISGGVKVKKMIKTTLAEIKRNSRIEGREEFKEFLIENDLIPVKVELIAYSVSVYGLGAYLAAFTLNNGLVVWVNTGSRSSWNYCIENSDFGL